MQQWHVTSMEHGAWTGSLVSGSAVLGSRVVFYFCACFCGCVCLLLVSGVREARALTALTTAVTKVQVYTYIKKTYSCTKVVQLSVACTADNIRVRELKERGRLRRPALRDPLRDVVKCSPTSCYSSSSVSCGRGPSVMFCPAPY